MNTNKRIPSIWPFPLYNATRTPESTKLIKEGKKRKKPTMPLDIEPAPF
jgi:hypothetical protein